MKNYKEFLRAKDLIAKGKIKEGTVILKRLQRFDKNNLNIKYELACLLIKAEATKLEGKQLLEEMLGTCNKKYAMYELAILECTEENYEIAERYFKEIVKEEYDFLSFAGLATIEIIRKNLINAEYYFNEALYYFYENNIYDKKFHQNFEKIKLVALNLMFLEIKNERFERAYSYYLMLDECPKLGKASRKQIEFYLKYKLNILTDEDGKFKTYFYQQLLNYDSTEAIKHIKLHLDENDTKKIHSCYNENLNIDKLFEEIQLKIANLSPYKSTLVDKYNIEYDYNIGSIDNIQTNFIRVITILNTKDIITMYPILKEMEESNLIEEDYLKVKQIKRESQIDKFNKKYGLK